MATPHPPVEEAKLSTLSAIENELPTYRAISTQAIFAFVCGLLALFSVANSVFYLFAVLAIVLGVLADRSIRRYPDILTGRWLAQAGIAFGLVFGLSILTISSVQAFILRKNAEGFAKHYAQVLKDGELGDVLMLTQPPAQRKSVTPKELTDKLMSKDKEAAMYEMKIMPVRELKRRLESSPDQEIHFDRIEKEGNEGIVNVAIAVFEVHGPATPAFPEAEQHAMAVIKSRGSESKSKDWWIEELVYPYKLKSAEIPEAKVDDGHGHAH